MNSQYRSLNYNALNIVERHPALNQPSLKTEGDFFLLAAFKSNGTEENHSWKVISNNERSLDWRLLKQYLNAKSVTSPQDKKRKSAHRFTVRLDLRPQITCCSQQPLLCSIKLHKSLPWRLCRSQNKPRMRVALREAAADLRMEWCHTHKTHGRGDREADASEAEATVHRWMRKEKKIHSITTNS